MKYLSSTASSLVLTACIGIAAVGCEEKARPPAPPAPSQPTPEAAAKPARPVFNPEYSLRVEVSESEPVKYAAVWEAKVNSGGWKFVTESVLVEDMLGKQTARVYTILEEPGADEAVTMAMETVTGRYESDKPIEEVELSVKRVVRGVKYDFQPLYSVVKTTSGTR